MSARFSVRQLDMLGATIPKTEARPEPPRAQPEDMVNLVLPGRIRQWERVRPGFHQRHFFNTDGHRSAATVWGLAMREHWPSLPVDFEIQLLIELRYPVPKSWRKADRLQASLGLKRPILTPDCSNVLKLIEDAGRGIIWVDDDQVCSIHLERCYAVDGPAVWLRVRKAPPPPFWEGFG